MSRRGVDKSGAGAFLLHPAKDHSSVSYGRFHKIDFKGLVYVLSSGLTLFLIEEKLRLRLTETSPIGNATRLPARCQLEASEHVKLSFIFSPISEQNTPSSKPRKHDLFAVAHNSSRCAQ